MFGAVVGTFHSLPLLAPLFKLIGIGYTGWFVYKFLRSGEKRQSLAAQIRQFRQQMSDPVIEIDLSTTPMPNLAPNPAPNQMFAGVVGTIQVLIPLVGVVDTEVLSAKLQKDLSKAEAEVQSLSQRLENANFVDKAPAEVVQSARTALAEAKKQAEILQAQLKQIG